MIYQGSFIEQGVIIQVVNIKKEYYLTSFTPKLIKNIKSIVKKEKIIITLYEKLFEIPSTDNFTAAFQ